MIFPLSGILYLFSAAVLLFLVWRVYKADKQTPNLYSRYISRLAFFTGVGRGFFGLLCIFFSKEPLVLGIGDIITEIFFFIGFVYGVAVFFYSFFPNVSSKKIFYTGWILVGLATIFHIIFFYCPFIDENGILHLRARLVPSMIYSVFALAGIIPALAGFAKAAITRSYLRKRASFFAIGLFVILIGGILVSGTDHPMFLIFSFFIELVGFSLLLLGTLFRPKEPDKSDNNRNP